MRRVSMTLKGNSKQTLDERKCESNWSGADKPGLRDESPGQKPERHQGNAFTLLVSNVLTLSASQTNHLFATIRIK